MKAFKGLFIKELILTRSWFIIGISLLIVAFLTGVGLTKYFNEPNIFAFISIMILIGHAFYLPTYLLASLNIEGQSQLWLHNPNGGASLFLAKLAAGFVSFIASFIIALVVAFLTLNPLEDIATLFHLTGDPLPSLFMISVGITLGTVYLGVWVLFYWSLFHSLKNVPILSFLRWPILIGSWMLLNTVGNFLQNLAVYQKLERLGEIKLNVFSIQLETGKSSASAGIIDNATISITNGLIYTVLVIIVFFSAVWLLERKVEV